MATTTRCQALVAGFGRPGMRDLDFGRQLIRYLEEFSWPDGVVVEDLSHAAPLVLHRLQELHPAKLVLVGAAVRGVGPPGTVTRRGLDAVLPGPDEVQRRVEDSLQGVADVDHTLALARHWGDVPVDTVIIEVEPADCSFGVGFSDELAASFDEILDAVRGELGCTGDGGTQMDFDSHAVTGTNDTLGFCAAVDSVEPSDGLSDLVRYAHAHDEVRLLQAHRGNPLVDRISDRADLVVAGRSRPWGVHLDHGGDWSDVIPLEDGWFGIVMGDVAGRGVEAAGAMSDLRAVVRAYAVLDGKSPARVLGDLDRLVETTGLGEGTTLVYMALHPATGELRFSNAGHCPPLVLSRGDGQAQFIRDARGEALGAHEDRPEATLWLAANSTLVLFTDGLLGSRRPATKGLETIRRATIEGPFPLDALCDHLLRACGDGARRDDDICVLALRIRPGLQPGLRRSA